MGDVPNTEHVVLSNDNAPDFQACFNILLYLRKACLSRGCSASSGRRLCWGLEG